MATDVALIGLACRFPGDADNPEAFWNLLCDRRTSVSENPSRWNPDAFYARKKKLNTSVTRRAHYLKQNIAAWDAKFFDTSSAEAEAIDPQQRILLEVVYEAFENAGLPMHQLAGSRTGVFVGSFSNDYGDSVHQDPETASSYSFTGTNSTSASNRISWFFDLRGPSFTLNTACSSSLVAMHSACQSLHCGDSDFAVVGGSSLLLNPAMFMHLSNQGFLSQDGRCKSFDASGDGYGRGEGFAAIVLRRANDAIAFMDRIRAVVRGTGCNQDGKTLGLTQPSATAQASLTKETYQRAGLDYSDTHYVETHGTGTQAGDFEEALGLSLTISAEKSPSQPLLIGSAKSNIGHLEGCAGLAGVIKTVFILERGVIPPMYGIEALNPKIKWTEWNLEVPTEITPWPTSGLRRISVQGFGYGGCNAHAILDDATSYIASRSDNDAKLNSGVEHGSGTEWFRNSATRLYTISAHDEAGVQRVSKALANHLARNLDAIALHEEYLYLRDLAYTLNARRSKLPWQRCIIASSLTDLRRQLVETSRPVKIDALSPALRIGFVFTGQGSQWPRMGHELMPFDAYRESIEAADRYLQKDLRCNWSVIEELGREEASSHIHETEYAQTLCTVLQVALVDLLASWNIHPSATVGHSSGEIAAAYCASALTRENAWKIAYFRGWHCGNLRRINPGLRGAMVVVSAPPSITLDTSISSSSNGEVSIACFNSPSSITYAGDEDAIAELTAKFEAEGKTTHRLRVDQAYHSSHMQAIAHDYMESIEDVETTSTSRECKFFSSVHGGVSKKIALQPAFWVRNLTAPVHFAEAVQHMVCSSDEDNENLQGAFDVLVEIGPHDAMKGAVTQTLQAADITGVEYLTAMRRNANCAETILMCAGALLAKNVPVDLMAMNQFAGQTQCKTVPAQQPLHDLPSYPWDHAATYWSENRASREFRQRSFPRHDLLGVLEPRGNSQSYRWRNTFRIQDSLWIKDHMIHNKNIFPGAGYLAMVVEAVQQLKGSSELGEMALRDVHFLNALILPGPNATVEIFTEIQSVSLSSTLMSATELQFVISSLEDGISKVHARGVITTDTKPFPTLLSMTDKAFEIVRESTSWYKKLDAVGLNFGPSFQRLMEVSSCSQNDSRLTLASVSAMESPDLADCQSRYSIHPVYIDSILQTCLISTADGLPSQLLGRIPAAIKYARFNLSAVGAVPHLILASSEATSMHTALCSGQLLDSVGASLVHIEGLRCVPSRRLHQQVINEYAREAIMEIEWTPVTDSMQNAEGPFLDPNRTPLVMGLSNVVCQQRMDDAVSVLKLYAVENPGSLQVLCLLELKDTEVEAILSNFRLNSALPQLRNFKLGRFTSEGLQVMSSLVVSSHQPSRNGSEGSLESTTQSFDIIIASERNPGSQHLARLSKYLTDNGRLLINDLDSAELAQVCPDLITGSPFSGIFPAVLVSQKQSQGQAYEVMKGSKKPIPLIICRSKNESARIPLLERLLNSFDTSEPLSSGLVDLSEISKYTREVSQASWIICAFDFDGSLLSSISQQDFQALQILFEHAKRLIWLQATTEDIGSNPSNSLVRGLCRVLRIERPSLAFVIFDAGRNLTKAEMASTLRNLLFLMGEGLASDNLDSEYIQIDGILHCSRFRPAETLNQQFNARVGELTIAQPLFEIGKSELYTRDPGSLDSICFTPISKANTTLGDHQIEVEVKAVSINAKDLYTIKGIVDCREATCACEFGGVITHIGSAVSNFSVGDRVVCMAPIKFGTIARIPDYACLKLAESESFQTMCTVPLVGATAVHGLENLAKLQPGETVLIHSGAGGVGMAAVQFAQRVGAEIFVTVGTEVKKDFLIRTFGLKESHVLNSRDTSFGPAIMALTGGRGVDVVLNSLIGDLQRVSWGLIREFGRFIDISKRQSVEGGILSMDPFSRSAIYHAFDLMDLFWSQQPEKMMVWTSSIELFRNDVIKIIPHTIEVFDISCITKAFQKFSSASRVGKIVISLENPTAEVQYLPPRYSTTFDRNKAYLLVGCLGGLGRVIARWMVKQGANHLYFLGRSGASTPSATQFAQSLKQQGVDVRVVCGDVENLRTVEEIISEMKQPLGGVVHAAMHVNEALFSRLTAAQWHSGIGPKVQGAQNILRAILPHQSSIDFFLLTSSISGTVGSAAESIYCSANTFLDAFAHHCKASAIPAVSVAMGIISGTGFVHERPEVEKALLRKGFTAYNEEEALLLIDLALSNKCTHFFTGLELSTLQTLHKDGFNANHSVFADPRASIFLRALENSELGPASSAQVSTQDNVDESVEFLEIALHNTLELVTSGSVPETTLDRAVEKLMTAVLAGVLIVPRKRLDSGMKLSELGLDSMLAAEIVSAITKAFGINLGINALLEEGLRVRDMVETLRCDLLRRTKQST